MILFNFAIGNGDAHRKNFSLLTGEDGTVALSPAYDLVSSRLVIPEEDAELALTLNGRRNRLNRGDFLAFANHVASQRPTPKAGSPTCWPCAMSSWRQSAIQR